MPTDNHDTTKDTDMALVNMNPFADLTVAKPVAKTTTTNPPTEKQVAFFTKLVGERFEGVAAEAMIESIPARDKRNISKAIDELLALPKLAKTSGTTKVDPPEGIHKLGEDIFKVQVAKQGSGNLYAKRLNREAIIEAKANDEMLGKAERWEYIGRRGVFNSLTADTLLSVEEAAEFGHLYGICACCAADLTNEDSIARGIGPVCFGRMG